jgi:hypothetical protein
MPVSISNEMLASFPAEEAEAIQRTAIALAKAEDSARRAEGLGDRELFMSGFGVIGAPELAEALRLRAKRLEAVLEALVARQVERNKTATEVAEAAVVTAATEDNDGGKDESAPRRGRPPKPREV